MNPVNINKLFAIKYPPANYSVYAQNELHIWETIDGMNLVELMIRLDSLWPPRIKHHSRILRITIPSHLIPTLCLYRSPITPGQSSEMTRGKWNCRGEK